MKEEYFSFFKVVFKRRKIKKQKNFSKISRYIDKERERGGMRVLVE